MRNIYQTTKYTANDLGLKMFSFIFGILVLDLISIALSIHKHLELSADITLVAILFTFFTGLGLFRRALNFNLANSITRYEYLTGYLIAIILMSLPLSILDWLIIKISAGIVEYNIIQTLYQMDRLLPWAFFNFSLSIFILIGGLFLSLLVYHGKLMKFLGLMALLGLTTAIFHKISSGVVGKKVLLWTLKAIGLQQDVPNPLTAATTLLILAAGLVSLNYLLIRKAEVKN